MRTRIASRMFLLLLLTGIGSLWPQPAMAGRCEIMATDLNFGSIRLFSVGQFQSLGTITYKCYGHVSSVRITLSAGGTGTADHRGLSTPNGHAPQLAYDLSLDAAGTRIWGDGLNGTVAYVASPPKNTEVLIPVFGRLRVDAQALHTGLYTDTVSVQITWQ
jgi:spore coat protein U-like protein